MMQEPEINNYKQLARVHAVKSAHADTGKPTVVTMGIDLVDTDTVWIVSAYTESSQVMMTSMG